MLEKELELMTKVSLLYYKQEFSQREIAKKLDISRPKVSRLLNKAKEEGIVKIEIVSPVKDTSNLESEIELRYNLKEVLFIDKTDNQPDELIKIKIANKCSEYLERITEGKEYLGLAAGTTLYKFAEEGNFSNRKDYRYIPLIGSLSDIGESYNSNEICSILSKRVGGTNYLLSAPALVKSQEIADSFRDETRIKRIFNLYKKIDVAILGIGVASKNHPLYKGHLTPREEKELEAHPLCGSLGIITYDQNGEIIETAFLKRSLGIDFKELLNIPIRIGLAFGVKKREAIFAAIKGEFVNVLITDLNTGQWLNKI
ncbi:sugar-binding domain-containing protein [Halocella sp. SP3-1]|uniref:sugar-binding transcriptional regulator n=1 Tax=Halocella sp. SP3-1 TaxID=2382161 RepID=UPI000F751658|nr:sugar-binding domain-containing protein [Halocella sp. SP3-1]AZO94341.1 winged helix-turn-helix transcriptional regulator [Halocella sp. SP3-1]